MKKITEWIKMYRIVLFVFMLSLMLLMSCESDRMNEWKVVSPDGKLKILLELVLTEKGNGETRLSYSIFHQDNQGGAVAVIVPSRLGVQREDASFVKNLKFISASGIKEIDESYTLVHGKQKICRAQANELSVTFANSEDKRIQIILRAYDNGIAFRYHFPEQDEKEYRVLKEYTEFGVPTKALAWIAPHDNPGKWGPAYELYYKNAIPAGTSSPNKAGWSFPALFNLTASNHWILISEAGLDKNYFGARLEQNADGGKYQIRLPDKEEGLSVGDIYPVSSLPWKMPWRVIMVGDSLKTIVESSLITDLAQPSEVENIEWIKPGRASWSWWTESDSPQKPDRLRAYIDFAVEMGWEYSLVDANWNFIPREKIRRLINYANKNEVGLLFWYNSGGPHNEVSEQPRDKMDEREARRKEFAKLRDWGVKGVKVDFFQSDKQSQIAQYIEILEDAAEFELMVNFHGCTIPRGWRRTYPNLMSMESVKGAECYKFDKTFPQTAPGYNTIIPFTRNVIGPMDYTPVTFSAKKFAHKTTWAHELALSIIFESGWQHFADSPSAYKNQPEDVISFLKNVPTAWDEIKFVDGMPGEFIVLARRKGDGWYLAGINGTDRKIEVALDFSFLNDDAREASIFNDSLDGAGFSIHKEKFTKEMKTAIRMKPFGGFVFQLTQIIKP